jgi:hypothetical protein
METETVEKPDLSTIVSECAQLRDQAASRVMTIPNAIDAALWIERTPDAIVDPTVAKDIIRTLHAALQASPCYYKAARLGIPTFVLLAHDRAGHDAIFAWARVADMHGCRAEKVEDARAMAVQWSARPDCKWPD